MHIFKTLKPILFLLAFYWSFIPLSNACRVFNVHQTFTSINDLTMTVHIEHILYNTNAQAFKVPKILEAYNVKIWFVIVIDTQIFIFSFFIDSL